MKNKTIEILSTFSNEEIVEFGKFVNSPYFNENSKLARLFEAISHFHPDYESKFLSDDSVYRKVNPDLAFNKFTLKKMFSGLNNVLEKYLVQKNFEHKPFEFYDNMFDAMLTRNLQKLSGKCIENCQEILHNESALNSDYFLYGFKHLTNVANYLISAKPRNTPMEVERVVAALSDRGYNITGFFIKEISRCFDNILAFDKNFDINKEKYFVWKLFGTVDFPRLFEFMRDNAKSEIETAVCNVYCAWYLAFSEFETESHYDKYKTLIFKSSKYFSHDEMRFHILRLMRYCLMKIAESKKTGKFESELFDIYIIFTEKGFYKTSVSDYLSVEAFRPIVQLGLKLKKYKWTLEFINKFKNKLPPDRRKNMFHYASALYFFHIGKHSESMKHSQKVEFDHFLFRLDLRDLMLMTCYEMRAFEAAISHIDTYKHFLSNDKALSPVEKKRHKNFIDIVRKLIEYMNKGSVDTEMKIELLRKGEISNKEWIDEKVYEVFKSRARSA